MLLPQVPADVPVEGVDADAGELGHPGGPEVAGLGQDGGVEVAAVLQLAGRGWPPPAWVRWAVKPVCLVDLDEQLGQGDRREAGDDRRRVSAATSGSTTSAASGLRWSSPVSSRRTGPSPSASTAPGRRGSRSIVRVDAGEALGEGGG